MAENIRHFRDLRVYQNGLTTALEVFKRTKLFPAEEKYSLTDQIRRSSRSVCANIAEAWRKRRYPAAFVAKLSDAETEAAETQVWIEVAHQCGYLSQEEFNVFDAIYESILGSLVKMASDPSKWTIEPK
jgi:four helix bundle protein